MAVRRRAVRPDTIIDTDTYGPVPVVSDDAFLEAIIAAAQVQAMAGGVLTVVVDRHPTDLDGERVTTAAVVEWKDRTDAKPQPERSDPLPVPVPVAPDVEPEVAPDVDPEPLPPLADLTGLDDEDMQSVPEPLR